MLVFLSIPLKPSASLLSPVTEAVGVIWYDLPQLSSSVSVFLLFFFFCFRDVFYLTMCVQLLSTFTSTYQALNKEQLNLNTRLLLSLIAFLSSFSFIFYKYCPSLQFVCSFLLSKSISVFWGKNLFAWPCQNSWLIPYFFHSFTVRLLH